MLRFNPFTSLFADPDGGADWVLQAPLPGVGLQRLSVSTDHFPVLFERCRSVGDEALAMLDPDTDLDTSERDELITAGILLTTPAEPENILFSCSLGELSPSKISDTEGLIVDVSLRCEHFNLARFAMWAGERRLSPYSPSVWVRDPETGYEAGYWLEQEDFDQVGALTPGGPVPADFPVDIAGRLVTAGILVPRDDVGKLRYDLPAHAEHFAAKKYTIVRNVIPRAQLSAIGDYFRRVQEQGFMVKGDDLVEDRFVAPLEPFSMNIHRDLTKLMSTVAGHEVRPSYCYASAYCDGAVLRPHTDRAQCEFSFSLQLGYSPLAEGELSPWPLNLRLLDESEVAVHLAPGDLLAYRGREVTHWRPALPEGHTSRSLFLHYVDPDFDGQLF